MILWTAPTTDQRELIFTRNTEPEADQQLLLDRLGRMASPFTLCRHGDGCCREMRSPTGNDPVQFLLLHCTAAKRTLSAS